MDLLTTGRCNLATNVDFSLSRSAFSSFLYTLTYNRDIRYDNVYVSTYFRQIDARRRKV
ncbi:hypothetical protein scyTo_0026337, partial [Scyliorhinus torazame]|nr:hypothetical protein [Scyliorhinus torazame]